MTAVIYNMQPLLSRRRLARWYSLLMLQTNASEERLACSSKPQNEPIEPAIEEIASREISESRPISQATSEEQPASSSKTPNVSVGPGLEETTSREISEHRASSQATSEEQPISSSKPPNEAIGPVTK